MNSLPQFFQREFDALAEWLLRRGKGIYDIVGLEGYLTAVVIGPNTLSPLRWLPKAWGGAQPKFRDLNELNQFIGLVVSFYNDIALQFDHAPDRFRPTFYESRVDGKRVQVVDEWCVGFLKAMRLDVFGGDEAGAASCVSKSRHATKQLNHLDRLPGSLPEGRADAGVSI